MFVLQGPMEQGEHFPSPSIFRIFGQVLVFNNDWLRVFHIVLSSSKLTKTSLKVCQIY